MSAPHFHDTNILLYSISAAPEEITKKETAIALLDKDGGALSVQVLQGFTCRQHAQPVRIRCHTRSLQA